jgi:protoheme IX farnesyltransferase
MREFLSLTKPTISLLVVITGAAGLVWQGSLLGDPMRFIGVLIGLFLASGCANGLNQYFERDLDALMERTAKKRPPRIEAHEARSRPRVCALVRRARRDTVRVFYNMLAASLALATIVFYSLFYTLWLKPRTPQNIVIGGVAGAMGPVIAWAAAAGTVSMQAALMFLIIFFWTPPHFWALALCLREDYKASKLPMMPNIAGEDSTLKQMFAYSIVLMLVSFGLMFFEAGLVYGLLALVSGAIFMWKMVDSYRKRTTRSYWMLFGYSIIYLFVLFIGMMVDVAWNVKLT